MNLREASRVIILADALLQDTILKAIVDRGATGYNVSTCFGKGRHESFGNAWIGSAMIRVEAVAPRPVVQSIVDFVHEPRWQGHPLSAFVDTVEVDSRDAQV